MDLKYAPWKFEALFETELGQELWQFLTTTENLIRMETAVDLKRTSVEALERPLNEAFRNQFSKVIEKDEKEGTRVFLRVKQMIGHMVGQIMIARGLIKDSQGVFLPKRESPEDCPLKFLKATRFRFP